MFLEIFKKRMLLDRREAVGVKTARRASLGWRGWNRSKGDPSS